jgi:hypothetical protein
MGIGVFRPGSKDGVNPYLTRKVIGWVGSTSFSKDFFFFPPLVFLLFFFFGFLSLYYYVRN